jgi:hypothetical protein
MRTDPRAEEVRELVETVFAGFLGENQRFGHFADDDAALAAPSQSKEISQGERRFPRLYESPAHLSAKGRQQRPAALKIDEMIVIDHGRYVARSYRVAGCLAMWLVSVGIVQFYDRCGEMLATINLFESLRPERMVA